MELHVDGMTCGHCVRSVTRALSALDPAAEIAVDLAAARVRWRGAIDAAAAIAALAAEGYAARTIDPAPHGADAVRGG